MSAYLTRGTDSSRRPIRMSREFAAVWDRLVDSLGFTPVITQGGWMGSLAAKASGPTHDGDALDLRVWNLRADQVARVIMGLRALGVAAWLRNEQHGGFSDPHIHAVPGRWAHPSPAALRQWDACRNGRDGLASNGRDYHPYPLAGRPPTASRPGPVTMRLRLAVTNIPTKVGEKSWARCFELMADKADIFGINEAGSKKAKALYLRLAQKHGLGQYGTRVGPNPVFWNKGKYRRVSSRQHRLHGAGTGRLARRYPGYNSARFCTEVVLAPVAGGPQVAVLNTHLVPNGRKNSLRWRLAARRVALVEIRELVRKHREAGRVVVLMGDMNIALPFFVVRGWRWLRGRGIDKVGVLTTKDRAVTKVAVTAYPAPTDHKRGISATVNLTRSTR